MTRILPALVLLLGLLAGGCARPGPEAVLDAAVEEAQDGHLDRFLAYFEPRSRMLLGMVYASSHRYGYLGDDTLSFMADLKVIESTIEGDVARLTVDDGRRQGILTMVLVEGEWKIDLRPETEEAP